MEYDRRANKVKPEETREIGSVLERLRLERSGQAELVEVLETLSDTASRFDRELVPECCLSDDGTQTTNHWSGTLDEIREHLGRELTEAEVTVLSLSRCFGPCPALQDKDTAVIMGRLWPEGNNCGLRLEWKYLAEKLGRYVEEIVDRPLESIA
jgi:hypothetical protein